LLLSRIIVAGLGRLYKYESSGGNLCGIGI